MRVLAKVSTVEREGSEGLYRQLCDIYPEGDFHGRGFAFTLPYDEPRTQTLLAVLADHGFQPINSAVPGQTRPLYSLSLVREYTTHDFEEAELLRPVPLVYYDSGWTLDGRVTLIAQTGLDDNDEPYPGGIQPDEDIAQAQFACVVSSRLRGLLEQSSLTHFAFKDVVIDDPEDIHLPGPIWQLTSDLILPPLSPRNFLTDAYGKVLASGERGVGQTFVREGQTVPDALYEPVEMHYSRAVLDTVGSFDLALAYEWSSSGYLVVSSRFYRFCTEAGLKMRWEPVRIDS